MLVSQLPLKRSDWHAQLIGKLGDGSSPTPQHRATHNDPIDDIESIQSQKAD
jgi:hypothetical protein